MKIVNYKLLSNKILNYINKNLNHASILTPSNPNLQILHLKSLTPANKKDVRLPILMEQIQLPALNPQPNLTAILRR